MLRLPGSISIWRTSCPTRPRQVNKVVQITLTKFYSTPCRSICATFFTIARPLPSFQLLHLTAYFSAQPLEIQCSELQLQTCSIVPHNYPDNDLKVGAQKVESKFHILARILSNDKSCRSLSFLVFSVLQELSYFDKQICLMCKCPQKLNMM